MAGCVEKGEDDKDQVEKRYNRPGFFGSWGKWVAIVHHASTEGAAAPHNRVQHACVGKGLGREERRRSAYDGDHDAHSASSCTTAGGRSGRPTRCTATPDTGALAV